MKYFVAVLAVFAYISSAMASGAYGGQYGAAAPAPIANAGYVARGQPAVQVSHLVPVYNIPLAAPSAYGAPLAIAAPGGYGAQPLVAAPQVARYSSAAAAGSSLRLNAGNYGAAPIAAGY